MRQARSALEQPTQEPNWRLMTAVYCLKLNWKTLAPSSFKAPLEVKKDASGLIHLPERVSFLAAETTILILLLIPTATSASGRRLRPPSCRSLAARSCLQPVTVIRPVFNSLPIQVAA